MCKLNFNEMTPRQKRGAGLFNRKIWKISCTL